MLYSNFVLFILEFIKKTKTPQKNLLSNYKIPSLATREESLYFYLARDCISHLAYFIPPNNVVKMLIVPFTDEENLGSEKLSNV